MTRPSITVTLVGVAIALTTAGCVMHSSSSSLTSASYREFQTNPVPTTPTNPSQVLPPSTPKPVPVPLPPPPPIKKSFGKRIAELFRGTKKEELAVVVAPPKDTQPAAIPPAVLKSPIEAPAGADIREIEGGNVIFKYEGGRLKAEVSLRVKGQTEPLVLRAESDFSRGKVSNVVGHVEYPKPPKPASKVETAGFSVKPMPVEAPDKIPMARDLEVLPMPKSAKQVFFWGPYFPAGGQ